MITFRDLISAFRGLGINPADPVIAHASLSAFGSVQGGAKTVLGAILCSFDTLVMPAFTYRTMVIPETGPPDNGLLYGSSKDANLMAEFFMLSMPVDRLIGVIAEALRRFPKARRSSHPILSFVGVNAERILVSQTMSEPLEPFRVLMDEHGWVLLLGVDHTANTSIHYAERLAGRKQFIRWALTPRGVVECPHFPGCSDGFQTIAPKVENLTRRVQIGEAQVQAFPLVDFIEAVRTWVEADPLALLCDRMRCERCDAVRAEHLTLAPQ